MIYLTNSTDLLQIKLGAAVTANEVDWVTTFHKHVAGPDQIKEDISNGGYSNGTSDVTIVPGPVESVHVHVEVSELHIYNRDTGSVVVTVKLDRNGTEYILHKDALAAGASLQYTAEGGFSHSG